MKGKVTQSAETLEHEFILRAHVIIFLECTLWNVEWMQFGTRHR